VDCVCISRLPCASRVSSTVLLKYRPMSGEIFLPVACANH